MRHSWRIGLFFSSHGSALREISKRWKKYTPQIGYGGFFQILHFSVECPCNPWNAFKNFRLRFYLLLCLLIFGFWLLSQSKIAFFDLETNRRFRNKNQKEKINFSELLINTDSFETTFFILSTIKNTGQVFRVIWPHLHRFRQIWRNGHVDPY